MKLNRTPLLDLVVVEPTVFEDKRGYFFESYHAKKLAELGIDVDFVQDNQSFSKQGTIRGLHYQTAPYAQTKLVRVIQGEVWDVAVDLRPGTKTFGKWEGVKLSADNKKQLLIPKGFAHGFAVLSQQAIVLYKCDAFYFREAEQGIVFNDPTLAIDWQLDAQEITVSEKDRQLPTFQETFRNPTHA